MNLGINGLESDKPNIKKLQTRTSPVVQWLKICLPMQVTRVQSLVQDPTGCRATKPDHCNYQGPLSRPCTPQQEKPSQWEAHAPQAEWSPLLATGGDPHTATKTQHSHNLEKQLRQLCCYRRTLNNCTKIVFKRFKRGVWGHGNHNRWARSSSVWRLGLLSWHHHLLVLWLLWETLQRPTVGWETAALPISQARVQLLDGDHWEMERLLPYQ